MLKEFYTASRTFASYAPTGVIQTMVAADARRFRSLKREDEANELAGKAETIPFMLVEVLRCFQWSPPCGKRSLALSRYRIVIRYSGER